MYKDRHLLSNGSLYALYCSLFLPFINYCSKIWVNTYKTYVHPIYILQKMVVRIISNFGYIENPLIISFTI